MIDETVLDSPEAKDDSGRDLLDIAILLLQRRKLLLIGPFLVGLITAGITLLIPPTYTARTTFLPPVQQQSTAALALASLGNLAGLGGPATTLHTPADQYVALMQSVTITDRIIDQFNLMQLYGVDLRMHARKILHSRVSMSISRKDGLVTVDVDDHSPQRAADIANRYLYELKRLTDHLALTEAQRRRAFFEQQLNQTKERLAAAQKSLLESGFTESALKADPKAAADGYAKLRAELTASEARLQAARSQLLDSTPEVQQQAALVASLRSKLTEFEQRDNTSPGPDYVSKYREFKYQEALFDIFARQYELARADESREGPAVQVIDVAQPPERKSKPARTLITLGSVFASFMLMIGWVLVRETWERYTADPANADQLKRLYGARNAV